MKTLIEKSTKVSKYLFTDESEVILLPSKVSVIRKDGQETLDVFTIADLDENNSELISGVTAPTDWIGNKYIYDNSQFTLNPNWVEPIVEEE